MFHGHDIVYLLHDFGIRTKNSILLNCSSAFRARFPHHFLTDVFTISPFLTIEAKDQDFHYNSMPSSPLILDWL